LAITYGEVSATAPKSILIQGTLENSGGGVLTGTYPYYVAFFTDPVGGTGIAVGSGSVSISETGRFSIVYEVPEVVLSATEVWYEMAIDTSGDGLGSQDIFPGRVRIHSVPFALKSADSDSLGGRPANEYAIVGHTHVLEDLPPEVGPDNDWVYSGENLLSAASGDVGIGTPTLEAKLHVHQDRLEGSALRVTTSATGELDYAAHISGTRGIGVFAESVNRSALRGEAGDVMNAPKPAEFTAIGLVALGSNRGIWASSNSGIGTFGTSVSNYGLWGQSSEYRGVTGRTERVDNNYGLFTFDNLYSSNFHSKGAKMQIVQNGGDQPLEKGEVVVFSGLGDPNSKGESPVPQVSKAQEANSTGIAGVVFSRFNIEAVEEDTDTPDQAESKANLEVTPEGAAGPGDYLLLVIQGPAQVKTESLAGAIEAGTLLSSCETPGCAGKAAEVSIEGHVMHLPGTVVGKALQPLTTGEDMIYAFIALQ